MIIIKKIIQNDLKIIVETYKPNIGILLTERSPDGVCIFVRRKTDNLYSINVTKSLNKGSVIIKFEAPSEFAAAEGILYCVNSVRLDSFTAGIVHSSKEALYEEPHESHHNS